MCIYKIVFKPKKYKPCCIMKILEENKKVFNIYVERISATVIEKSATVYITITHKPKKYIFLLFTDIIRDLLPLESSLSFKLVQIHKTLLYHDE